jgi:hypothetical protein
MKVRAKFRCDRISHSIGSKSVTDDKGAVKWVPTPLRSVTLNPVYANSDPAHENSKFWAATPSGTIELGTINEEAAAIFELGKEYYVDFTPAQTGL